MIVPLQTPETHKAVPPLETVHRIRKILANLDIITVETFNTPTYHTAAYSCRVELGDEPFLGAGFSVNGKGMSPHWALASAYGELIERLSCGTLLPQFPDETNNQFTLSPNEFAHHCPDAFVLGMGVSSREALAAFLQNAYQGKPLVCSAYTDVESGEQVLLPDDLLRDLCGTTGLCAGNTPSEAMLQGLMEIFERYATRKIYQYQLTPPPIPDAYFEGAEVLHRIRALGLMYSIRDCSLGKRFPVIGLVLTLPDGKRTMRLGAAASPVTALERCLTEIYQGTSAAAEGRFQPPGALDLGNAFQLFAEYCETISTGSGAWPDETLDGEPSYPFTGFGQAVFGSDGQALHYYTALSAKWGGRLYARNCSVLGFPAYRLYMPGASEAFFNFTLTQQDYILWQHLRTHRETVLRLPYATPAALKALALGILSARKATMPIAREPQAWLAEKAMPGIGALEGALIPLLLGAAGYYSSASTELSAFLATPASEQTPKRYLKVLTAFWLELAKGISPEAAADSITQTCGTTLSVRCLQSIAEPATLFSQEDWPVCPDCGHCALRKRCRLPAAEALAARLRTSIQNRQEEPQ